MRTFGNRIDCYSDVGGILLAIATGIVTSLPRGKFGSVSGN